MPSIDTTRVVVPAAGPELLWSGRVSQLEAEAAGWAHILDATEQRRLAALRRAEDRGRYLLAHVTLRQLLADRLAVPPAEVVIGRRPCTGCGGPHGRPVVPGDPVHFSLSHSGDMVLIALARNAVGVDVEAVPPAEAVRELYAHMHPRERAELAALPAADRPAAFARCWSRKEAFLKATGAGLTEDPSVTYVGAGAHPAHPAGWRLSDLPTVPGYAAALTLRTDAALSPQQVPVRPRPAA
ncbi:4'-phosphopantetheinyl transferase family protein [Streptomyces niveus]|uniref:4'-phosphopantetheinyl transferase family protein n=1 Tax=Streptomyces niveus TaxID=193462 RepID=UPI0036BB2057